MSHALEAITRTYLQSLQTQRQQANITDNLSYRDFLSVFLRDAANLLDRNANLTGEPKKLPMDAPTTKSPTV